MYSFDEENKIIRTNFGAWGTFNSFGADGVMASILPLITFVMTFDCLHYLLSGSLKELILWLSSVGIQCHRWLIYEIFLWLVVALISLYRVTAEFVIANMTWKEVYVENDVSSVCFLLHQLMAVLYVIIVSLFTICSNLFFLIILTLNWLVEVIV